MHGDSNLLSAYLEAVEIRKSVLDRDSSIIDLVFCKSGEYLTCFEDAGNVNLHGECHRCLLFP
jgi:hypothetical protein